MSEAEKELEKKRESLEASGEDTSQTNAQLDRVRKGQSHARNIDHRHKHNDLQDI